MQLEGVALFRVAGRHIVAAPGERQFEAIVLVGNPEPGPQRERAAVIVRAVDRMAALIDDLLDVASLEARSLPVAPRPEAVGSLVAELVETMRPLATQQSLTLTADLEDERAEILADRARVLQVLTNLVSNAIAFTATGSIVVRTRAAAREVVFSVQDTGPGISRAHAAHVDRAHERRVDDPLVGAECRRESGEPLGPVARAECPARGGDPP